MTVPPISTITFACELCDFIHTSGEAPFRVYKLHCSEVGDIAGCIDRLRDRRLHTCGHTKRAWYDKTIAQLEQLADPHCAIKRQLVQKHHLQTVKPAKLQKLWDLADEWFKVLIYHRRGEPQDVVYSDIIEKLLAFGRVW